MRHPSSSVAAGSLRNGPGAAAAAAGPLLLEAVRRLLRQPRPMLAVVAHLSRLVPPAPRPHHRRIARAMIDEAATRHEGQVFALGGGDIVLLCPGDAVAARALTPLLHRLLGADVPEAAPAVTCWALPGAEAALLAFAEARATEGLASEPATAEAAPPASRIERLAEAVRSEQAADLLQRQTGIVLTGRSESARQFRALYREVSFSIAALEGRAGPSGAGWGGAAPGGAIRTDPSLFQHLATRLDQRMLALLAEAIGRPGALDPTRGAAPRLHLNLTLGTATSPAFAGLLTRIEDAGGACPAVEVALVDAVASPALLMRAARQLEARGCGLVIDGVAAIGLLLADLAALPATLLKVDWAWQLPRLPVAEATRLHAAIAGIGPSRIVLHRADSEAAIRWGLAHGIRRFQGRHVDAMLAASRLGSCRHAGGCTLRQCAERHTALGTAPRKFCRDHALLDAGAPDAPPEGPGARVPKPRAAA